ncbi:MAG: glutamine--fructose-6-phosphate transaminase (isomerizing) [Pseudomonadota bacterium]
MCGIVGYFGHQSPKKIILNGLKKLEYRGYDSAGLAILNNDQFEVHRAAGKLFELENKVDALKFSGPIGIGHTRWATHGMPTEKNAHPHKVKGVSVVQNGIIENYSELRDQLMAEGCEFQSETDTEVLTHLIAKKLEIAGDLNKALSLTIPEVRGAFALLAVNEKDPETIVACKVGPPLILGVGTDEIFLASDVQAFVEHTNQVVYIDDEQIVKVKGTEFQIFDKHGEPVASRIEQVDVQAAQSDKKGFKHYMLKEMFEQPRAVANAVEPYLNLQTKEVSLGNLGIQRGETHPEALKAFEEAKRILIVACGTSFYAGMYAKYLFEQAARIPTEVDVASEFRYREPVLEDGTVALFISQSGETADTLAALRLAKESGLKVISLCNTVRSTIDREADLHFYMNSGVEVGVASTKAFLSTLAVLNVMAAFLARQKDRLSKDEEREWVESLLALPSLMEGVLSYDSFFSEASKAFKNFKGFLYLGRGHSYPIALEGALKLKELAYMHAEGYAAGEMKHGPLALIDENMVIVAICPQDKYYEKTVSNLEEAKARGGEIISIGTGDDGLLKKLSEHYLSIPDCHWSVSGLLSVIPVQLLSYHVADVLGHDVDQPRNLAKSVTVE